MRTSRFLVSFALATAILILPGVPSALSQAVVIVDVKAVAKGLRTSKLLGDTVVNDKNERIGTIDDLIIDRDRVLFAVLQVGGFLGIGGRLVAVPYESLVVDEAGNKITLPGATRDQLTKLPEFNYET
jgi:sporulation protein YlmC with PRC-barrel domain